MSNRRQIVVIGGTQAGPTAAARAREIDEDAEITIVQRGHAVSFGFTGLHHVLSGEVKDIANLDTEDVSFFHRTYLVAVRTGEDAVAIDTAARTVTVRDRDGTMTPLPYSSLIFALGAESVAVAGLSGPNVRALRTLDDVRALRESIASGARRAVVVGGGSFGLEATDALARAGLDVTLVEKRASLLPRLGSHSEAALREAVQKVARLRLSCEVTGVHYTPHHDGSVAAVALSSGESIDGDLFVVCAGVRPRTRLLADAGIALEKDGTVLVDERAAVPGTKNIFACGASVSVRDAVTGQPRWWAQAAIADKVAQAAGENAAGGDARCPRFVGSLAVRAGDVAVGVTGLSREDAEVAFGAADVDVALAPRASHEPWMPGSGPLIVELVSQRSTGRVLGASAVGVGADKRLDVLAAAVKGALAVEDVAGLDLCAAGSFAPARDVTNLAATMASFERRGVGNTVTPCEVYSRMKAGVPLQILDVRGATAAGGLDGAIKLSLEELRARVSSLNADAPTVVYCGRGRTGWLAMRILKQRGFVDVAVVAGGLSALLREKNIAFLQSYSSLQI